MAEAERESSSEGQGRQDGPRIGRPARARAGVGDAVVLAEGARNSAGDDPGNAVESFRGRHQLRKGHGRHQAGKKDNPKPLAEKVAEAKPVDDPRTPSHRESAGRDAAAAPRARRSRKSRSRKNPTRRRRREDKPAPARAAQEPKPVEKESPTRSSPTRSPRRLKKEEKKPPPPKPVQAAKPPEPPKPKIVERHFDQTQIAALLDKRDPTRQAATGDTLNSNAALGISKGTAADNSATWGSMFQQQVERCWKKPYGGMESQKPEVAFAIRLKRDGTLEGSPVPEGVPATPFLRVYQESALRAIIECQPYKLPAAFYEEWKYFAPVFKEKV